MCLPILLMCKTERKLKDPGQRSDLWSHICFVRIMVLCSVGMDISRQS